MVWMDLLPVSLVLQDNRDSRRVTWPSFCLELSLVGLTSSGCSPKPHPSLVSLLAEMGLNRMLSGSSYLCPTWVWPFTLSIYEGIFSVAHTDSAVLPDSEGSHGDTGCLLPEIPSDVRKKRCYGKRGDAVGAIVVIRCSQLWKTMI